MSANPFPRWAILLISIVGGVSLILALLGDALVPGSPVVDEGPSAFSRSALGHRALASLLKRLDVPVLSSRHDSGRRAGKNGVLVLAEPRPSACPDFDDDLKQARRGAERILVILPKRSGEPHPRHPGWIHKVSIVPEPEIEHILDELGLDAKVSRGGGVGPRAWESEKIRSLPTLRSFQSIRSEKIRPLVALDGDILLGEAVEGGQTVWVLSDPDPFENHGLGEGDNAAFAFEVLDALRGTGGSVVFDETLHGHRKRPGPLDALLDLPLVLATFHAILAAVLFFWLATFRFGAPKAKASALPPGHRFLIENTAALWDFGGHAAEALRRYLRIALKDVAARLKAPPDADPDEWLERIASSRGASARPADLRRQAEQAVSGRLHGPDIVAAALRIHRWKEEMIHGRPRHPGGS